MSLLILTPHSSGQLPASVMHQMLGERVYASSAREDLQRRIFLDGDPYTELLFLVPGARTLNAPWSRFVVDLNRERGDSSDNGVVKRTGFDRNALYPAGAALDAEDRLRRYWDSFDAQVGAELQGGSVRLMIVGHSMASHGPALGPDQGKPRPAVTLMVGEGERATFPPAQVQALQAAAQTSFSGVLNSAEVSRVAVNDPWTTDDLSLRYHRAAGVPAFGVEFNAGLYLTAQGQPRDERIQALNAGLRDFAAQALALVSG
ncbi:N-formylglutamate amidohydrolase [Deinococcus sp. KNUC1210]|uniref:N-formylglutamate amidohydrolase n=1 Tax=Deinococcus sp. KNUC1210 TaxID=2917691 RepID=UPI001EF0F526|nr:N-formylglutamate amidohydrolase [Deinococcus sp. KNUC1210]ULH14522.1 N-formylglutamate amidohydrolase [Deinococcus sp. KNUC1210]